MQKHYVPFIAVGLIILAFFSGRGCRGKPATITVTKDRVVLLKSKAEKAKDTIIYRERVRIKIVEQWHEVRHDSLIPCEVKLLVCDTVIMADSSLIGAQKILITTLDAIVKGQDTLLKSNKKFWRGFKWGLGFGFAGGVIGTGSVLR